MKKATTTLLLTLFATFSFAHEGHDGAPGGFKSLHGGTVQTGKQLNLEVILNGKEITIFPTSHEGKDIRYKNVVINAIAKPKKGKPYAITFSPTKNGLSTTVDLKGSNRLPVDISVSNTGKTDHFIIQVEE